jgi:anti-anti-sigma factor
VRSELDEVKAPQLDATINGCRDASPVVVDLSSIEFISSAGLHVLLKDRPTGLALVCPPGNVRRLFEIVRANRTVPIFSDLDSATESFTLTRST